MNIRGIHAIYRYEMNRSFRTLIQSLVSPVLSTILYFIVFGAAIGSRMDNISNVSYGAFIVPGLIMLTVQMQSVNNASFGIYFPKFIGTTYELLSAPLSFVEIVIGYVGAATTKAFSIGLIILGLYLIFTFKDHNFKRAIDACIAGSQKLDKPMTIEEAKIFCEKEIMKN